MIRYKAGISLADKLPGAEVASRCGLKPLTLVMRESRLRGYGHVKRRQGDGVLGEVMEMEIPETRPTGRLKKTLIKNIEKDMCELNLREEDVHDRERWRTLIKSQTHLPG